MLDGKEPSEVNTLLKEAFSSLPKLYQEIIITSQLNMDLFVCKVQCPCGRSCVWWTGSGVPALWSLSLKPVNIGTRTGHGPGGGGQFGTV